jgi:predicted membrane channel-forming protein YqfA (hemolysin III family)
MIILMEKFKWDKKTVKLGEEFDYFAIIVLIRCLKILSMIPLVATVINTLI